MKVELKVDGEAVGEFQVEAIPSRSDAVLFGPAGSHRCVVQGIAHDFARGLVVVEAAASPG